METFPRRGAILCASFVIGAVFSIAADPRLVAGPFAAPTLDSTSAPPAESSQPPDGDFPFVDLEGGTHTLGEMRGQPTLLEFWASWCEPCRKGFPFLDMLQEQHREAGLRVVAVTLEEDEAAVRDFVSKHPGKFLVGWDPTGRAGELFEVAAMPTALLLDRQGRIMARFEGGTDAVHKEIENAVEVVMHGGSLQPPPNKGLAMATGGLRAWERGYLADPIMNLDGDVLTRSMKEHIHASKEGAAGDGGVSGGGCGCN